MMNVKPYESYENIRNDMDICVSFHHVFHVFQSSQDT